MENPLTPGQFINTLQNGGDLRVKKIINHPCGTKQIIVVDRQGKLWERSFFPGGTKAYLEKHKTPEENGVSERVQVN